MKFVDIKAAARRTVHATMAVPCSLRNADGTFALTARLHNKITIGGDIESQGFATVLEGVTRIILSREELALADNGAGVSPTRTDQVTFTDYNGTGQDVTFELDVRDPYDGPITEKWSVVQV